MSDYIKENVMTQKIISNKNLIESEYEDVKLTYDLLTYRNINAILDKSRRYSFVVDENNQVHQFIHHSDWWYDIDTYLDDMLK